MLNREVSNDIARIKIPEAFSPLFKPKRYKIFRGGRGGAKSRSFARALIILGMQSPLKILCTREIQKSIRDSVKVLLDNVIDDFDLHGYYTSISSEINGINGTQFIFAGLKHNPTTIKSLEGVDICWIEEADRTSDKSLKLLIPTIRTEGSEIWISYNPNKKDDPVHVLAETAKDRPADILLKDVHYTDNPWFPEVLKKEMLYDKTHDPDKYNHVWKGKLLKHSDSLVFAGKYTTDVFEAPKDSIFYLGADWGFSNDPSTLVRLYVDHDNRRLFIDYEAYEIGVEIPDLPAFFDQVPLSRKYTIVADSARPETISYMRNKGFKIVGAKKGAGSIEDGIEFLKAYEIIIHERCKHAKYEFGTYSYKIDKHTEEILDIVEDDNNHIIDPCRYATERLRKPRVLI